MDAVIKAIEAHLNREKKINEPAIITVRTAALAIIASVRMSKLTVWWLHIRIACIYTIHVQASSLQTNVSCVLKPVP